MSQQRFELDEAATVAQIAERRLWLPVMRPVPDRWLDLTIVIDQSPFAALWHDTIDAFIDTCRYLGAFRNISVAHLHNVDGMSMLARTTDPTDRMRPSASLLRAGRQQLILMITDGLGPNWQTGAAATALADWGEQAAVVLIELLPERLWRHTWLDTFDGRLTAPHRGASNATTRTQMRRDGVLRDVSRAIAIPVLELDRQWLRPWAHFTAGTSNRGLDAAVAIVGRERTAHTATPELIPAPSSPAEHAFVLRTSVAPDTFRLASLLAATAPLTIPVMRHIQDRLLPQTGPAEIAELHMSGIFEPTGEIGTDVVYDLPLGLRPVLQSTLRHHEIAEAVSEVGTYMAERHAGNTEVDHALRIEFSRVCQPLVDRLGVHAPHVAVSVRHRQPTAVDMPDRDPPHIGAEQWGRAGQTSPSTPRLVGTSYLVMQFEEYGGADDTFIVSHWYQWASPNWQSVRGDDRYVSYAELESTVNQIVAEMQRRWSDHPESVAIEFILPFRLLNEPVDTWRTGIDSRMPTPLVWSFPIVVRSLERIRAPHWHRQWGRRWQRLLQPRGVHRLYHATASESVAQMEASLSLSPDAVVLVLSEPPTPGSIGGQQLLAGLRAGLPAIFWYRGDSARLDEVREAIRAMIDDVQATSGLISLPESVARFRQESWAVGTGHHIGRGLALLWDDFNRQPARTNYPSGND
ncbi:hypothetical protein K7640_22820 [Micromonospora sp. PLK6-60]|nr:hypothetical protein [Micromonospora sp. PLK6-60]